MNGFVRAATPVVALLLSTACNGPLKEPAADPELYETRGGRSALTKGGGGTNGDTDFCNDPGFQCTAGEGDCDSDGQCQAGLVCGTDNGQRYGMPDYYDVCWPATCTNGSQDGDETSVDCGGSCGACVTCAPNGTLDTCAPGCRCASGWGDCDNDGQCQAGLVCVADLGARFGMPDDYDMCVPSHCRNGAADVDETGADCGGSCGPCPVCSGQVNGGPSTCTNGCPCDAGWGDCDSSVQCQPGLVCGTDNGGRFGMPDSYDVCWAPHCTNGTMDGDETGLDCGGSCGACVCAGQTNGMPDTCTAACPCDAGWGDCDANTQCKPGLVCAVRDGQRFGMPDYYDVCVPSHCTNGTKDVDETDADCGGSCGACVSCGGTNGTVDACSVLCPCASGWGDCDSDFQCQAGLVCGVDAGARFGMPPTYDVCLPAHCTNQTKDADETGTDCGGADCGACPTAACGTCHALPPANGTHARHFGAAAVAAYGGTGGTGDVAAGAAAYAFDCGNCHPLDGAKHRDGTVEVELYDLAAPAESLKARNPEVAAYAPGPNGFAGEAAPYTDGTCSSVYCHSRLEFAAPFVPAPGGDFPFEGYPISYPAYTVTATRVYSSPSWGSGALGCGGCHGMPPGSSYPANAAGAGDSHLWIDSYGASSLHGWALGIFDGPLACATCHYDTVTSQGARSWVGDGDIPSYGDVPIIGFGAHVNGRPDVRFTGDTVATISPYTTTFTASGGGGPVPSWDAANATCTNISCHRSQTQVRWGTPYRAWTNDYECGACHPDY